MKCARCDFATVGDVPSREQMAEHAQDSGHALCIICARSLTAEEQQTCEVGTRDRPSCLTKSRELLSGIRTLYDLAAGELGTLKATRLDADHRANADDGRPLPGGDALVLLGPGSPGHAEDGLTTKDGDVTSAAYDLLWWAEDWQDTFGLRVTARRPQSPAAQMRTALGVLEVNMRRASREHPAFDEFTNDLHQLHLRLERATGGGTAQIRAEAECFGCGADALTRQVTDKGYEDAWTCQRCGEIYDWPRYLLALSGRLQQQDVPGWGLPEQVGYVLGVNPKTVRGWAARGLVTTACVAGDRRLRVWWADARERAGLLHSRKDAS